MSWEPCSEETLRSELADAFERMTVRQRNAWEAIRIEPAKWLQSPYGDSGGGFWVVAIVGFVVVWFNDIEDGFECSRYTSNGSIAEYTANQFALETCVDRVLSMLETGKLDSQRVGAPKPA